MKIDNEFIIKALGKSWHTLREIKNEYKKSPYFNNEEDVINVDEKELELIIGGEEKDAIREDLNEALLQLANIIKKSIEAEEEILAHLPKYVFSYEEHSVFEVTGLSFEWDELEIEAGKYPDISDVSRVFGINSVRKANEEQISKYKREKQKFIKELEEEKKRQQIEDYEFRKSTRYGNDLAWGSSSDSSSKYCNRCQQSPCMCSDK